MGNELDKFRRSVRVFWYRQPRYWIPTRMKLLLFTCLGSFRGIVVFQLSIAFLSLYRSIYMTGGNIGNEFFVTTVTIGAEKERLNFYFV